MASIKKTVTIHIPAEEVFSAITNPKVVTPFIPGVVEITDVPPTPLRAGSMFSWEYQLFGLPFRGHWVAEEVATPNRYVATTTGGIASRWVYTLLAQVRRTELTLEIEFSPPDSVIKKYALSLIEPHTDQLLATYLENLKNFLEAQPAMKPLP